MRLRSSQQPKVLHIATVAMSTIFLRGQVTYMRERGLDVEVLTSPGEELAIFGEEERVRVHAVSMPRRVTPLQDLRAVRRIRRVIRSIQPQIVHAHTPKGGLLGMVAARLERIPVRIYQMRGLPMMTARGGARALLKTTERASCAMAHRVICNSRSMLSVAVDERLCRSEKITVLRGGSGNGVDSDGRFNPDRIPDHAGVRTREQLGIPQGAPVLGYVGRLVRDKGVVELVEAWTRLREEFPELHLITVGPFEPRDPVPPGTEKLLRTDSRIHLLGLDWNTPPLYAAMDVVALPTYREGFPNVPLEAAAMRLPVVATRVPGCVDAVADEITGLLVPPRDTDALHQALRRYLQSPELRSRHGAAARLRVVREFRQEEIWNALHCEYRALLEAVGLGPRSSVSGV